MTAQWSVAVTGAGALLGQGIIRALRGTSLPLRIVGLDVSPLSAGLYWCDAQHLIPKASDPGYIDAIARMLERERPKILFVGTDVELAPLAAARASLEQRFACHILVSSSDVVRIADDKFATATFMCDRGFAAPDSVLPSEPGAVDALIARRGFPLIVKPRNGARSYGVSKVLDRAALDRAVSDLADPVLQECVGNDDREYTASGLFFDGRCDAVIVMRRDLRDGNTFRAYVEQTPKLIEQVRAWTIALAPHGPANFQFRIDAAGQPKVFEINGRFSGTTPLRALCGFNEVELCLRRLLFSEPVRQPEVRDLTVLRHWQETVVEPSRVAAVRTI